MLPFLKNKQEASVSDETDDSEPMDMLDAVAADILRAVEKKDKGLLKEALSALYEHWQDKDDKRDASV